ncbi:MAG: hypothetical protein ABI972_00170, partial [Acidobacteriota bacterium]
PATNQLPPSFSKPTEEELLSVEIQALAELHRLKLCVNSGITVHRANSSVVISGYVQSQDQQDHLSGVLQGIGRPEIIDVRLSYPSQNEEVVIGASPFPTASSARIAPPIESWLRENLRVGTRTSERELFNLMNAVVLESEQVSGEAWALRHLAQQFPPDRTRHLSPFLNEQLLKMVDGHTTALREGLQTLQSRIEPVLGGLPAESGHPLADSSRAPWQSRAVALQLRVEPAVNQVFDWFSVAGPVAPRANSQTMSGALAMLNSLQIEIRDCLAAAGKLKVVAQNREAANGLP